MSTRVGQGTGVAGLLYVALLVANVAGTTDGPRPDAPAAREAARIATHATAIRWSALLGGLGTLALCAFVIGLALIATRAGRVVAAAALGAAGIVTAAVGMVSFSALAAAAESAQRRSAPGTTLALGDLHSISLLASFATTGIVLAAAVAAGLVRSRPGRIATATVAAASLTSLAVVLDNALDTGRLGAIVIVPFFGIPAWVASLSVRLLRGRLRVVDVTPSRRPSCCC